ncbi:hypothetical protein CERZMDRAFT_80341 [Cercospora zeae-maydis SCOH1-5]|uniref:Restriction of telomere capping protein 4 n=1 Tax=Cercospora zeae-maydis SCOH1-5 TaxID=717836 RepID=A0A6A6FWK2_9PEZI|nr:hypothetical protein CERZMDRAFT_80341 [Cercospora zeae-maydis SCOH1-5]
MQTSVDFDADPQSSDDTEDAYTLGDKKTHGSGSTDTKASLGSTKSSTKQTEKETKQAIKNDSRTASGGRDTDLQRVQPMSLYSSRNNDTITKKKFLKAPIMPSLVSDDQLEDSGDEMDKWVESNIHVKKKQKRGNGAPRSSQQSAGYGAKADRKRKKILAPRMQNAAAEPPKEASPLDAIFKKQDLQEALSSQTVPDSSYVEADDLSEEDLVALEQQDALELESDDGKVKCTICDERIRRMLKEEFEDEVLKDRVWSYRWQQRFCTWHKRRTVSELWKERGYPEIDWNDLRKRMRKHDKFLSDVLHDRVESHHREKLKDQSKHGRSRQKDIVAEGNSKFTMGYYGPRGERRVNDYIMNRFADDLRKRSTKDKLILASGIQGGVNGFVQLVLAPHLAELLVKEDLSLTQKDWAGRAREVLTESTEIGELLFPEDEDKFGEDAYHNHIVQDDDDVLDLGTDVEDDHHEDTEIEVVELD